MFNKNLFDAALIARGKNKKDLADYLGVNVSTIYRKIQGGGAFSRAEINSIIDYLGLTAKDFKAIFFG